MRISLVAAASRNHVIGKDNGLPWHLPADLRFFKKLTLGHPIIMGRRTWDSVGKALPGRLNVVVTRNPDFAPEGVTVEKSLAEALSRSYDCDEIFIVGGSEIYRQAMTSADRIYLTRIDHDFEGDTFFPEIDPNHWRLAENEPHQPDEKNAYPYAFQIWERRE